MKALLRFLGFAALSVAVASVGGRVTRRNKGWYRLLRKSPHSPPDRAFGLVWPVLYALGAWSAARVWAQPPSARRTRALRWWALQLGANAAWTPVFFGAHRPRLALGVLALNAAALAVYAKNAWGLDRSAALMAVPTLGWLGFAGTLNEAVIDKNRWLVRG